SVICSDKTGTLTQNQMTVTRLWVDDRTFTVTGEGYDPRGQFKLGGQPVDLTRYPGALTALWAGILASDAHLEHSRASDMTQTYRVVGDPTEGAIVVAAAKAGVMKAQMEQAYPRLDEVPFDSERKRMSTILDVAAPSKSDPSPFDADAEAEGQLYVITTKGAVDQVLPRCTHVQRMDD